MSNVDKKIGYTNDLSVDNSIGDCWITNSKNANFKLSNYYEDVNKYKYKEYITDDSSIINIHTNDKELYLDIQKALYKKRLRDITLLEKEKIDKK